MNNTNGQIGSKFTDLGVRPETAEALASHGIDNAFAIQEYAIPIALRGSDIIGRAPTGTGKTYGFGLPLIDRVRAADEGTDGRPQALVLVPTRELGMQVARDLEDAGKSRAVRVLALYGGTSYQPQIDALKSGVEIVVSTPGRLLDLYKSKRLQLSGMKHVVLDEADRMLDMGFAEDVEKILGLLPEERQTMLFSATMPDTIMSLSRRYMNRPITVSAEPPESQQEFDRTPQTRQLFYMTHALNKVEVLARALQARERGLTIIFCRTKRSAHKLTQELDFRGFSVGAVHGDLGQKAREKALRAFRSGSIDTLVATDVASRGIDVQDVTHVFNYDAPEEADSYTHRIGRTGRAGANGIAVTFIAWEEMARWKFLAKALGVDDKEILETYHTSDHLFADLDIPHDVTGSLASADRNGDRMGVEDADRRDSGSGGRNRRRGGGRRRSRQGQQGRERNRDTGSQSNSDGGADRPRRRRRRRGSNSTTGQSVPEAAQRGGERRSSEAPQDRSEAGPRRRRRRRRSE
ncbi:DEAD/DEAH box helicase [Haloglycomyces albus]|uniref:DEAD/DEAH box helicase n=1 Tax=Haloglycomyces albus TaxID=526067 RepID=UPI00046CFB10|nr:DEAD/DEAH box helicase [Haloglycomyces albus]